MASHCSVCKLFVRYIKSIRNVGIIAHIDAGKTTTTERMLFNSGTIKTIGEVDKGTTTTDYLDQERERGISITSSTATIKWKGHTINLIDTPGHVDFTLEVERALAVLDGSVTVLDATKGVEAQTQTVWNQARNHKIPNIFYLNKFDRKNADLNLSLKSIKNKLPYTLPLLIHLPYYSPETGQFSGIIDIINLTLEYWNVVDVRQKEVFTESYVRKISDAEDIFKSSIIARKSLLEGLVNLDDGSLREEFLILENPNILIPPKMIEDSLRKMTLSSQVSPLIIGSSKMNIGVNNILDKIVEYLPNPSEKEVCSKFANLASHPDYVTALSFKVIHDKYKGQLNFLRLYSGTLKCGQVLKNATRSSEEKISKIIQITGDHFCELETVSAGNIVAVSGLKNCFTGDLLIDTKNHHVIESEIYSDLISVPTPVIYSSIEASGVSEIKNLEKALIELSKEDPSFQYHRDEDTHQFIIGGMGKLHLEIIFDKIVKDYKLQNSRLGKIRIAYKESPICENEAEVFHEWKVSEKFYGRNVNLSMLLSASYHKDFTAASNIEFVNSQDFKWCDIDAKIKKSIKDRINQALLRGGSLMHCPVTGITINIHNLFWEPNNINLTDKSFFPVFYSFALEAGRGLLHKIPTNLLEPFMKVEISFNLSDSSTQAHVSNVLSDMNKRRALMINTESRNGDAYIDTITACIPLAECFNYIDVLRSLTSGNVSVHMSYSHYDVMTKAAQDAVTKKTIYRKLPAL